MIRTRNNRCFPLLITPPCSDQFHRKPTRVITMIVSHIRLEISLTCRHANLARLRKLK